MKKLQELLEDDYEDFESQENVEKSSYVLGSELWENKFDGLFALVNNLDAEGIYICPQLFPATAEGIYICLREHYYKVLITHVLSLLLAA